jgi:hypothetical protein
MGQMQKMQIDAAMADVVQKQADIELTLAKVESERAKALRDTTDAEVEQRRAKLDGLKLMLETERDRLAIATGAARGMAGTPGNNSTAQRVPSNDGGAQSGILGAMAGGQPAPGGAPLGPVEVGGMGGTAI